MPLALERMLSPAFIRSDDGAYGTRCSTLVITEKAQPQRCVTHVLERSFTAHRRRRAAAPRDAASNWPPRYMHRPGCRRRRPDAQEPVRDGELDTSAALQPRKRGRVRSLLKP